MTTNARSLDAFSAHLCNVPIVPRDHAHPHRANKTQTSITRAVMTHSHPYASLQCQMSAQMSEI